jgi:hypothetical protein
MKRLVLAAAITISMSGCAMFQGVFCGDKADPDVALLKKAEDNMIRIRPTLIEAMAAAVDTSTGGALYLPELQESKLLLLDSTIATLQSAYAPLLTAPEEATE